MQLEAKKYLYDVQQAVARIAHWPTLKIILQEDVEKLFVGLAFLAVRFH